MAVVSPEGAPTRHRRTAQVARHAVWVPSFDMQLCEDVHLMFGHMVMKALCGAGIKDE